MIDGTLAIVPVWSCYLYFFLLSFLKRLVQSERFVWYITIVFGNRRIKCSDLASLLPWDCCCLRMPSMMMRLCRCIAPACAMGLAHWSIVSDVVVMHAIGCCGDWIETWCNLLHAPMHETGWCFFERLHFLYTLECVENTIIFLAWSPCFTKVHST